MSGVPDRIKSLEDTLYSRQNKDEAVMDAHSLQKKEFDVPKEWQHVEKIDEKELMPHKEKKSISFLTGFLIFAIIFFIGAAGFTAFSIMGGSNTVSNENIDITIAGPNATPGGEKVTMEVTILNRNKAPLEISELVVEFPKGTRDPTDVGKELPRTRITLGTIKSGEERKEKVEAVLFGEEKSIAKIETRFEYRLANSNAVYYKPSAYEVVISSAPLALAMQAGRETNSGQEYTMDLEVRSNTSDTIKDVTTQIKYPQGFVFKSATPSPESGTDNLWNLGDFPAGSKRHIIVKGKLSAEDEEVRVFQVTAGLGGQNISEGVKTAFAAYTHEVYLKKPFLGIAMRINNSEASEVSVSGNERVRIFLRYTNNLPTPIRDAEIFVALSGSALNRSSVIPSGGFFVSSNNTVRFDKTTLPALAEVATGDSGEVSLELAPRPNLRNVPNPRIDISVSVHGTRVDEGDVPEEVAEVATRSIKVSSSPQLSSRLSYKAGALKNSGPIPPKVDAETTYTLMWSVSNPLNALSDAKVEATLPLNARFGGEVTPSSENVTYDEKERKISWTIGDLDVGVGFNTGARSVQFKVVLTPSISQVGTSPNVVGESRFEATDRFTSEKVSATTGTLTTRLTGERVSQGDELVAP